MGRNVPGEGGAQARGVTPTPRAGAPDDTAGMSSHASNRRDHYRVQYGTRDRPTFRGEGLECRVIDCSERGLHLALADEFHLPLGAPVEGIVRFRRGTEVFVTGQVVRECGRERGVWLDPPGLPLKVILDEQRWLRERGC